MTAEGWLNAYLDLNLLIALGAVLWFGLRWVLRRTSLGMAFLPQLRLMNGLTLLLALAPLLALVFTTWIMAHPPNLADLLVAQYLQGNMNISATSLETTLGLREDFVREMLAQQTLWSKVLAAVAAAGAGWCIAHICLSLWHLRVALRGAFVWRQIGRVQIRVSSTARVAFSTRGLFTRYVILPQSVLERPQDLRLTMSHELQHFRQKDIECEIVLELLRPFLFWNPAFVMWRREVRNLREYACDQSLSARPGFDVRAYCECLIRAVAEAGKKRTFFKRISPSVALVDGDELQGGAALRNRLIVVTSQQPTKPTFGTWALISAALVMMVLSTTVMLQRSGDWSHDRIMLSTIVNLERMASRPASTITFGVAPELQQAALQ
ncbi:BlaR1 peptidase M56 [Shimia isoporae]|uniref:BlaR1 peptidase M56 n=1 Tax=Shimia isoporae TaxID=647720 RepID=A0A4R1NU44_9RHOB|nr:M56 family metallopeptidase [Shimia isoporae]TCL08788.1 BlaR1 peptidase M56 [Shimia isoporae]